MGSISVPGGTKMYSGIAIILNTVSDLTVSHAMGKTPTMIITEIMFQLTDLNDVAHVSSKNATNFVLSRYGVTGDKVYNWMAY